MENTWKRASFSIPTQHPARLPSPGSANSSQLAHEAKELQGESVQGPTGMVRRLGGGGGRNPCTSVPSVQTHTSLGRHPVGFWGKAPAEQQLVRALFQTRFSQYFPARSSLAAAYPRQEQPLPKPSPDASQRGVAQQRCARSSEHTHTGLARDLEWFCFKLSPKPRWGEDKKIQTPCS